MCFLCSILCNINNLVSYNFTKSNIKAPYDGAEAPKPVGALVI